MNRKVIISTIERHSVLTSHIFFSEKYVELEIFIIILETNLVDIVEAMTEEIIASILLTSLPFPLIAFTDRFRSFFFDLISSYLGFLATFLITPSISFIGSSESSSLFSLIFS